uniref:Golgin candidate 2 n=1 Tax=Kalanchoe fedtschenkoi TaxID=63787 RepID=A0A7N0VD80_KALFE
MRRLGQMTDHLIQKQAQVEALSSEKATFQFRIEAASRSLEEKKSLMSMVSDSKIDIESGTWDFSKSKDRPSLEYKVRIGQQQLGSVLKQLDAIFSAGSAFLRRNPTARWWSLGYLICLHFWVMYILMSESQSSDDMKSGAVVSLENINNTVGF